MACRTEWVTTAHRRLPAAALERNFREPMLQSRGWSEENRDASALLSVSAFATPRRGRRAYNWASDEVSRFARVTLGHVAATDGCLHDFRSASMHERPI